MSEEPTLKSSIEELLKQNVKPKEIAERLGTKLQYIYGISHKLKKENGGAPRVKISPPENRKDPLKKHTRTKEQGDINESVYTFAELIQRINDLHKFTLKVVETQKENVQKLFL